MRILSRFAGALALIAISSACLVGKADAAPTITNVSPRGLTIGAVTTLTVTGAQLTQNSRVLLATPIAEQTVQPGAKAGVLQVAISLDAGTPAGVYLLRIGNGQGVSNAVSVSVDSLPQQPFAEEIKQTPVAMTGALTGSAIQSTRFRGAAGQRVVIDVEAQRLGSKLNPVLELVKPDGVQLAYSQYEPAIAGDARLDVELPAAGEYTIKLHDALFRGGAPGFFRLKVGAFHYADNVFPSAARRGERTHLEFVDTNLKPGASVEAAFAGLTRRQPAPWPNVADVSGVRPSVTVSDIPEIVEAAASAGGPQAASAPVGISGRLSEPGQRDRYLLRVKPGMKLRFDVLAERIGSPIDGVLTIADEKGSQLAANDDRESTTDPGLDFNVPKGVNAILVSLEDRAGRGGSDFVYHISADERTPDFSLSVDVDRFQVPRNGAALVRVKAQRAGFNGPIKIALAGKAPSGVRLAEGEIPPGVNEALLTLTASDSEPGQALAMLVGEAAVGKSTVRRLVLLPETDATRLQPWLRGELAVAVTEASALQVAWKTPSDAELRAGQSLGTQVEITRGRKPRAPCGSRC